jgi:DNA repair protein RadD
MKLRDYQSKTVADLFAWWTDHQENNDVPLLVLPTAAGKSVICADIVRRMFDDYPDFHPRTVVLVPSKELAEQNAAKLVALLPSHVSVGFVSASLGKKQFTSDVIVATIGSIAKSAHLLGNIKVVIIDEAHLVSTKGADAGMYRQFLASLAKFCNFRVCGMTATPFRGNGVWLTDGDSPLFTGIAHNVTMRELLDDGYIAPLVPPPGALTVRIDSSNVGISNGDYKINELSEVVEKYLQNVAEEAAKLAADRKKWIAFTPSVANAESLCEKFNDLCISSAVVCGDTPKDERERLIRHFRQGKIDCLVTVLALSVGFDVPDVDCIVWCRPTKSPVLYVQGMGRGVRIYEGKADCLVLDFTDTVERLGPVDTIRGRSAKGGGGDAPYCLCPECGDRNHATAMICAACGAIIREEIVKPMNAIASRAALLSHQVKAAEPVWIDVTKATYSRHQKEGKPDTLRVDYYGGILRVASEWVCFDHSGYARNKADDWFRTRKPETFTASPGCVDQLLDWIDSGFTLRQPNKILTRQNGKFTEIVSHDFN